MKNFIQTLLLLITISFSTMVLAQDNTNTSNGNSGHYKGVGQLNVGLGVGFNYGSAGFMADYEFLQLGQDFTMAAAVSYYGWDTYYAKYNTFGVGVRFRWYADRVLGITSNKWDVFASGDVGFGITNSNYHNGYDHHPSGSSVSPIYWGLGIGTKYHFNDKIGLHAIIGTGAQIGITFGL
ncbi:hypothetical protein KMW28_17040 [Flammeovirga yaeyamensis]|uniref:Outer membrane protein beta-barrel domain-containing protein n=1 Tax=Flammeovirga yaeyamensis TaxID=367791 RepID=A0AAX1N1J7_9BACT|nr:MULTISPECIES: hypothetical protein [Flammeovirga]ANQ51221.2 hypothetical protein MY04_3877 [Flammeovirga sp. MY04]MBB3698276.1 hypothetical protein [Flammeovirga yaeyamensis]NMF34369.1 hypothetical protein [Flammeovirga yaeyamensis]QWG01350.1 hypothetical protein KMW28_17040 [Flammeovirga yaeyamensis]